jgi:hypothetical protein
MKKTLIIFSFALLLFQCSEDISTTAAPNPESCFCSTLVTVRDQTGLDACSGFAFELPDGSTIRPVPVFSCGTPPVSEKIYDPLEGFEFVDGKKALIDYELLESGDFADACMGGPLARITCLSEIGLTPEDTR